MLEASPTIEMLARAIDACALRQAVYSANIANADVEGYRRLEVMFDADAMRNEVLAQAGGKGFDAAVQPQVVSANAAVKLDEEMGLMARNALRYQTLLAAYERSTGLTRLAIKEGREA